MKPSTRVLLALLLLSAPAWAAISTSMIFEVSTTNTKVTSASHNS